MWKRAGSMYVQSAFADDDGFADVVEGAVKGTGGAAAASGCWSVEEDDMVQSAFGKSELCMDRTTHGFLHPTTSSLLRPLQFLAVVCRASVADHFVGTLFTPVGALHLHCHRRTLKTALSSEHL